MKINRELQIKILTYLEQFYPENTPDDNWEQLLELANGDEDILVANMFYLDEHGLINSGLKRTMRGMGLTRSLSRMNAAGHDFLVGDGGMTVLKNTITVRFHQEAVQILESHILQSPKSPQDKQTLVAKLRELPFSAIEHLMKKLLDEAILHLPEALQLIEKVLR